MQLFPCPFCGPRPETEFQFAVEAGKTRPEGEVSDAAWARYLHGERNPKGASEEVWLHLTCGDYFLMRRDTLTHGIEGSRALGAEP